jgi:hypothetical protein
VEILGHLNVNARGAYPRTLHALLGISTRISLFYHSNDDARPDFNNNIAGKTRLARKCLGFVTRTRVPRSLHAFSTDKVEGIFFCFRPVGKIGPNCDAPLVH